ncbi:metallophosphoesterase [Paenibacillus hamazuiensis]|uniref:metallophosphoesterase n=1 Tax=Paenibacillus hamazuiensis TaxID=2936508 RepID=UPI00200CA64C|nr:metallophosphoesterase [Paenibacillus hamazuiensis]
MRRRFILFFLVFNVINAYIGWHGSIFLGFLGSPLPQGLYWFLFAVVVFSYLLGRSGLVPGPAGRFLKVIGSYYFFVMEYAFLLLLLTDIAALGVVLGGGDPLDYAPAASLVIAALLLVLLAWGSRNAWSTVRRTYEMKVGKRAGALKELRIMMVSDIHLGNIVGRRHLRRLIRHMNEMRPDLILLPGDVIDDSIEPFIRNRMGEVLGQLKARFGVFAVLGNHEYYGGHIAEYVKQMSRIGIRVLRDETVTVDGSFHIVGRKDKTAESFEPQGRQSVEQLIAELDRSLPIIVMDHQPTKFEQAAAAGADLLLCGHTHRGQFAPNHLITRRLFELDWGYMMKGNMHVAVSSGFGSWGPPIRIASRSEIVELVVKFRED